MSGFLAQDPVCELPPGFGVSVCLVLKLTFGSSRVAQQGKNTALPQPLRRNEARFPSLPGTGTSTCLGCGQKKVHLSCVNFPICAFFKMRIRGGNDSNTDIEALISWLKGTLLRR